MGITVGNEPIGRSAGAAAGTTWVDKVAPSNGAGIIHTVEMYLGTVVATDVQVGIFYVVSGNNLTCRAWVDLGGLNPHYQKVTGLSLAVEIGDYIGCWISDTVLSRDNIGTGNWAFSGQNQMGCVNTAFVFSNNRTISLKGTGGSGRVAGELRSPLWGRF